MPDARIVVDGHLAADPQFNTTSSGRNVANLRVLAGRSRKLETGEWETLSTTAYACAFWNEHHDLAAALDPHKGDRVIVSGTIAQVDSFEGRNGLILSIVVNADGLRAFPKQQGGDWQADDRQGYRAQPAQRGGGFSDPQPQGNPAPQGNTWGDGSDGWGDPPF